MIFIENGNNVPISGLLPQSGGTFTYWAISDYARTFGANAWNAGGITQESGHDWCMCDKFELDSYDSVRFNIQASHNSTGEHRVAVFTIYNDYDECYKFEVEQSTKDEEVKPVIPERPRPPKTEPTPVKKTCWIKQLINNIIDFFKRIF
jgi:hypothetical protein